jgi:hypothetical protein
VVAAVLAELLVAHPVAVPPAAVVALERLAQLRRVVLPLVAAVPALALLAVARLAALRLQVVLLRQRPAVVLLVVALAVDRAAGPRL